MFWVDLKQFASLLISLQNLNFFNSFCDCKQEKLGLNKKTAKENFRGV